MVQNHLKRSLIMSKLVVHAKMMIDGVSDTPKKDQLISIEDGKIVIRQRSERERGLPV